MATFRDVPKIQNGTPVNEGYTNRPINALEERDLYLKKQLENVYYTNRKLFLTNEPCADSCQDSYSVYLNESTGKWEPAAVYISGIESSTQIVLQPQAFVQGIAKEITGSSGSKTCTIIIYGYIDGMNPSNCIEEGGTPVLYTPYYLSILVPGKITRTRPASGAIFVGKFRSLTSFIFSPSISVDSIGAFKHEHFTIVLDNSKWIDDGLHGTDPQWLYPAAEIPNFPPIPFEATELIVNGNILNYGDNYNIDSIGLHFWSSEYEAIDPYVSYKIIITRVSSALNNYVSSIRPATSNIIIRDYYSEEESFSGNLSIGCVPTIEETTAQAGSVVVKNVGSDNDGNILVQKGNVVEKLEAGNGIALSAQQGTVKVSTTNSMVDGIELTDITLIGAKERIYPNTFMTYIELPQNMQSSFNVKYLANMEPSNSDIYGWMFSTASLSGSVSLTMQYQVQKLSSGISQSSQVIGKTFTVDNNIQKTLMFSIPKGNYTKDSIITFSITRNIDSYSGNIGFIVFTRKDN